jgi:glyoxylase-like metal-dependent hydrolase (beta-lactamase superfamily II)
MHVTSLPSSQVPGVYHRRLGDVLVTALSDGYLDMSLDVFRGIEENEARALMARESRIFPPRVSVNVFVLRWPGHTVLIDCGSQDILGPTCGWLPSNLAQAGIAPEEVTTVLLTHMHPDHSNGLTHVPTGRRLFPNAEVVVHDAEPKHWFDDAAMARADERRRITYFQAARDQLAPYMKEHLRTFNRETEVLPGIVAIPCEGHTPGHSSYVISSNGRSMIVWGDTVHIPELQIANPHVTFIRDVLPDQCVASRERIFDRCVADKLLIGGMHVHFPGLAHLRREHGRYELTAEQWAFTL